MQGLWNTILKLGLKGLLLTGDLLLLTWLIGAPPNGLLLVLLMGALLIGYFFVLSME
ncbi:hypothetical protein [Zobellella taiwanensis]